MKGSRRYVCFSVISQWISLVLNILMMAIVAFTLASFFNGGADNSVLMPAFICAVILIVLRFVCSLVTAKMGHLSSKSVRVKFRRMILDRLYSVGHSYEKEMPSSEVIQVSVEGVDQMDTYFSQYLPQFFFSMIAPLTLFCVLVGIDWGPALVLLLGVPLIPISIAAVQTFAKKLLGKYWDQYAKLGDSFLENLQGLVTLKVFGADSMMQDRMNTEAEHFRKITMKVLTMQLNSITIMDLVAFGGAAAGIILASWRFSLGAITLGEALLFILLSADFFIPMRQLGSFFHIAMNGMAASDRMFRILAMKDAESGDEEFPSEGDIEIRNVTFSYDGNRNALEDVTFTYGQKGLYAVVGESGSGKSTLASLIAGRESGNEGTITIGGISLSDMNRDGRMKNICYISHDSFLFRGSVRENMLLADPAADDDRIWKMLEMVNLASFVKEQGGLGFEIGENGSRLSGGQRQRLAMARAMLLDARFYIFDEATSNIDRESEDLIMRNIMELSRFRGVLVLTHRLKNVEKCDNILVLENAHKVGEGNHERLLESCETYRRLYDAQAELERYAGGEL